MTLKNIPLITFHVGKRVSESIFCFDGQKINYQLRLKKKDILFSRHNLVTDGVFKECQLILCRNVLIYFNEDLQNKAFFIKVFYQYMVFYLVRTLI
jgi:chemotaxis protein methyltransferase CheR